MAAAGQAACKTKEFLCEHFDIDKNKYAIHAYTHGPVTGSGPSVKPLKYVTHLLVASTPGLGS